VWECRCDGFPRAFTLLGPFPAESDYYFLVQIICPWRPISGGVRRPVAVGAGRVRLGKRGGGIRPQNGFLECRRRAAAGLPRPAGPEPPNKTVTLFSGQFQGCADACVQRGAMNIRVYRGTIPALAVGLRPPRSTLPTPDFPTLATHIPERPPVIHILQRRQGLPSRLPGSTLCGGTPLETERLAPAMWPAVVLAVRSLRKRAQEFPPEGKDGFTLSGGSGGGGLAP